jgi:hypothetical protein
MKTSEILRLYEHNQFRGEAGILLDEYGSSPGDLDFIDFLR